MTRLEKKGILRLPKSQIVQRNYNSSITDRTPDFEINTQLLNGIISDYTKPILKRILFTEEVHNWNYLIEEYHYLGSKTMVGNSIKYFIYLEERLIGCIGFADAVLKFQHRDQWIGWTPAQRNKNLKYVINNVRFLIFPWIKIKNLASTLLSICSKIVPCDWEIKYSFRPLLMETFIEKECFAGTCYKASNWLYLGETKGKGRKGMNYFRHNIIKQYYVFPLHRKSAFYLRSGKI